MANPIALREHGLTYYSFYDKRDAKGRADPNFIFSNYWPESKPLTVGGIEYRTPEHYFQAQKFPVGSREHSAVLNTKSADDARNKAGELFKDESAKARWFDGGDYEAMLNVVKERLKQDPKFKKELMSTGSGYILEDTYKGPPTGGPADKKWGGGADGMGENLLGMALMEVRNEELGVQVDIVALRKQAQVEREQLDKMIGSNATKGKSLSQLQSLYTSKQPSSSMGRVLNALHRHHFNAVDLKVVDDINKPGSKVIKVAFQDDKAARAFAKFAGNAHQDGLNVILGPVRAQRVFENLRVGQHGRSNPRPMFNALVFDNSLKEYRKIPHPKEETAADLAGDNLRDSEKELFQKAFKLINTLKLNPIQKKSLRDVFQNYQKDIDKDRYSDTADERAHGRLNYLLDACKLKSVQKLSNLVGEIKREVVANNNRPSIYK